MACSSWNVFGLQDMKVTRKTPNLQTSQYFIDTSWQDLNNMLEYVIAADWRFTFKSYICIMITLFLPGIILKMSVAMKCCMTRLSPRSYTCSINSCWPKVCYGSSDSLHLIMFQVVGRSRFGTWPQPLHATPGRSHPSWRGGPCGSCQRPRWRSRTVPRLSTSHSQSTPGNIPR